MQELSQEQKMETDLNGSIGYSEVTFDEKNPGSEPATESSAVDQQSQKTIPYERFQEVISEKNQLKNQVDMLMNQMNQISQGLSNQNNQNNPTSEPKIDTVDDLVSYMENKLQSKIQPLQETIKMQNIQNTVGQYFANNKEASELKDKMDAYAATLPQYRRDMILDSLSRGDKSVIDELFFTVKYQQMTSAQNTVKNTVKKEADIYGQPQNYRTVPRTAPSYNDLASHGAKTGDFNEYFTRLSQNLF